MTQGIGQPDNLPASGSSRGTTTTDLNTPKASLTRVCPRDRERGLTRWWQASLFGIFIVFCVTIISLCVWPKDSSAVASLASGWIFALSSAAFHFYDKRAEFLLSESQKNLDKAQHEADLATKTEALRTQNLSLLKLRDSMTMGEAPVRVFREMNDAFGEFKRGNHWRRARLIQHSGERAYDCIKYLIESGCDVDVLLQHNEISRQTTQFANRVLTRHAATKSDAKLYLATTDRPIGKLRVKFYKAQAALNSIWLENCLGEEFVAVGYYLYRLDASGGKQHIRGGEVPCVLARKTRGQEFDILYRVFDDQWRALTGETLPEAWETLVPAPESPPEAGALQTETPAA